MALPKRIEEGGAFYHVMARGNGLQWIYIDILREVVLRSGIALIIICGGG